SEQYYRKSLELKRTAGNARGVAVSLLNAARVYRSQKRWSEARAALAESAVLFETGKDHAHAGEAYREMARLAKAAGATADTVAHATKSVELFERAGNKSGAE